MKNGMKMFALTFGAGCIAAFIQIMLIWVCDFTHIIDKIDIKIPSRMTLAWIYPHLVFGGLWAMLFFIPIFTESYFWKGVLLAFIPAFFELFFILPKHHYGLLGMKLGYFTPLFLLASYMAWGAITGMWLKWSKG